MRPTLQSTHLADIAKTLKTNISRPMLHCSSMPRRGKSFETSFESVTQAAWIRSQHQWPAARRSCSFPPLFRPAFQELHPFGFSGTAHRLKAHDMAYTKLESCSGRPVTVVWQHPFQRQATCNNNKQQQETTFFCHAPLPCCPFSLPCCLLSLPCCPFSLQCCLFSLPCCLFSLPCYPFFCHDVRFLCHATRFFPMLLVFFATLQ